MILQGQINRVLAAEIDFFDLEYRLSPLPPDRQDQPLEESIGRVGLLCPPILRKRGDIHQPLSGHHRAWVASHRCALSALPCLVLPFDHDDRAALALALEALSWKRTPSPMELASFCRKMLHHAEAKDIAERFFPRLGLTPTPFLVEQYARLTQLEEPFAVALHQGRLQEGVARELLSFSLPERLVLFELIEGLHLSAGNQRKLVESCRELGRRDKISPLRLLGGQDFQEIIKHPEMNVPQKSAGLMRRFSELRQPQLLDATNEFAEFKRSLALPDNWQLTPTPSFEDERVTLSITLKDRESLRRSLPLLLAAAAE